MEVTPVAVMGQTEAIQVAGAQMEVTPVAVMGRMADIQVEGLRWDTDMEVLETVTEIAAALMGMATIMATETTIGTRERRTKTGRITTRTITAVIAIGVRFVASWESFASIIE